MNNILNRLEDIPPHCISDAMQGLNHLDPAIKPLKENDRAFTGKNACRRQHSGAQSETESETRKCVNHRCKGNDCCCKRQGRDLPISCGGVQVQPGNIIAGDADGVVIIPQTGEETIFLKALVKMNKDQERADHISANSQAVRQHLDEILSE
ncbi:hypothetical protein [Bacillus sonorensis]|uniref:RraA family protein n=1 Tax=Bacillus sonorensis TaxID=119858 RepID=UPI003B9695A9